MAPFKFEEDIKTVLEKRTIQPSKLAWDELEKSLDKNKKKPFWWIGLAASIVGILWISISFFNQDNAIVEPTIVDVSNENYETPTTVDQKIIKEEVVMNKPILLFLK